MKFKQAVIATLALAGATAAGSAQAREPRINWSVTIGAPFLLPLPRLPVPVSPGYGVSPAYGVAPGYAVMAAAAAGMTGSVATHVAIDAMTAATPTRSSPAAAAEAANAAI